MDDKQADEMLVRLVLAAETIADSVATLAQLVARQAETFTPDDEGAIDV